MQGAGGLTMLEVSISRKQFDASGDNDLEVLRDLHFSCATNSFTSIVGPSGCGKTTTLRCILALDTDFEGSVNTPTDGSQTMAAVFQEPRLLPWRTVEQNVRLALNKVDNNKLDQLFDELGLTDHREFYPTELSLGLARRVGLARAFALEPSLLVLDEPFVSLDDETAGRLRKLLARVWSARSCTALMVTHNLTEAIELSDRILFFSTSPSRVIGEYGLQLPRNQRNAQFTAEARSEIAALNFHPEIAQL